MEALNFAHSESEVTNQQSFVHIQVRTSDYTYKYEVIFRDINNDNIKLGKAPERIDEKKNRAISKMK